MTSNWRLKLDPRTRAALEDDPPAGPVEVVLGLAHPLTADQRRQLEAAGLHVHSGAGRIVSGRVASLDALARVADTDLVRRVEVSRPMHQERHEGPL